MLKGCPPGAGFTVDEFWRLMRAPGCGVTLVGERDCGSCTCFIRSRVASGSRTRYREQLQGRFVIAFVFEYAATLGLLDVACVPP